jgi:hypothetical protein
MQKHLTQEEAGCEEISSKIFLNNLIKSFNKKHYSELGDKFFKNMDIFKGI